jgi:hypothetical protein
MAARASDICNISGNNEGIGTSTLPDENKGETTPQQAGEDGMGVDAHPLPEGSKVSHGLLATDF